MSVEDKFCPSCKMSLRSHSKQDLRDCIKKICPCDCHNHFNKPKADISDRITSCQGCKCYEDLK